MAIPFIASNEFLNPATAIDLTSSPQLVLTNNSTFTNADNLTTIEGEEVSGSGYARINLSVLSNSVQPGGDYKLIYDLAQITPSGGSIAFDRVVLISGSNWVGYWQYGTTTIANGQTYPFRGMTIQRTDQGTLVNGQNGLPAWTTTAASFTHPASIGQTVSVTVGQTSFMAVGSYVYFDDGVSRTQYKVTAIGSGTNATLERTTDEVVGGTTMQSGGKLVPSGKNGINSFGLAYTYSSTLTAPPSSGQVRLNNATLSSVTAIYASETDRNSVNISTILNGLNPGSILQLVDESTPTAWAIYQLNTLVDSGSYSTIGVTHIGSTGTFSGDVRLVFANKGNTGATGATGSVSSATSLTLTEQGAITSTAANEIDLVNVNNELQWRLESDGLTRSGAYKDPDINAQTGTTYTLALSDRYGIVTMNNASANTVTIPTNASVAFPVGTMIELWQIGAGATTYDGDVGVTVNGVSGGGATSNGQYSAVSLRKIGTDSWLIAGGIGSVA